MYSIFSHTQQSYSEAMFALFGKGKQHAARLYSDWFRNGNINLVPRSKNFQQFDCVKAPGLRLPKKGVVLTKYNPLPRQPNRGSFHVSRTVENFSIGVPVWAEPQAIPLIQKMIEATDFTLPTMSGVREEGETVKFLLKFADSLESESVLIPMEAGNTLCISSQVGCRMGCAFCETGKMGLIRHLNSAEIVAQLFWARFVLAKNVRNVVFMGMGEPFDNYEAVMQAIGVMTDSGGLGMGPSRITVSTSGKVDAILRMSQEVDPALNLAVSVNAPSDAIRNRIMPVNRQWNMAELKSAMQTYCEHPRREIFIEYVLIKGINDSLEAADELAKYLHGLRVKVNLIPYNPQSRDRFAPPEVEQREEFLKRMRHHGYQTLLRGTKGQRIRAACGQLGNVEVRRKLINL
jgi:23S rRNA (adenine2503-C2)-methyltransferase